MIDYIISDVRFLELLDRYSANSGEKGAKVSEILKKLADGIKNPEMIVPVLGSQGLGKSTLINAILGDNILPNDADETTCVPVEIRYGSRKKAKVFFQSSQTKEIELSCDSLREFVDNNENNGNEKRVSYIALELPNALLQTGLVIVDLPGVGSLTPNNQETTMRYIRQLCTAIFVIPTVPTIRRSEEIFIRGAWSSFSSAIFVQNRWDDETDQEVEDSVSFNTSVLKKIATNAKVSFDGKICVVNAYQAILSRLHNNDAECKASNLPELIEELEKFGSNRKNMEIENFRKKVLSCMDAAQAVIMQYIAESQMTEEQLRAAREKIRQDFQKATEEIQNLVDELLTYIFEEKRKTCVFAKELSRISAENLRADIRKLIDAGVVDGNQLTEAFSDYQEKYLMDAIEQHYDYMNRMTYDLGKRLEILSDRIEIERASSFEAQKFENGQSLKFEKGLEVGLDIAGALGGLKIGTELGTMVGTAIGGPVGTIVGAVVGAVAGIGVSIVAGLFGKKTRQEITATRASQAKRAIEPYILEFSNKIYQSIIENTDDIMNKIEGILHSYIDDRRAYYEKQLLSREQTAAAEHQQKFNISELEEHYNYLESKKEGLR